MISTIFMRLYIKLVYITTLYFYFYILLHYIVIHIYKCIIMINKLYKKHGRNIP